MTGTESDGFARRTLLRTGVNVGVGAGLVWGIGSEYATTDGTTEIEYALVRSDDGASLTPRTKAVPAEWYAKTRAAFDVQRRLEQTPLSSLVGSFVVPGGFDDPSASVSVDATAEGIVDEVADLAEGVEVRVNVLEELPAKPERPPSASDPYEVTDLDRRRVPGGVRCRAPVSNGTLTPAAFDAEDDRRYFLTANHLFGEKGTKEIDHRDEPLSLASGTGSRRIGRVQRGFPAADAVLAVPDGGALPTPEIERADPSRVAGQFTRMGLAGLMARDEPLYKFGAYSGLTEGSIHGVDGFTCYTGGACKSGQLRWGSDRTITDGDSGSVNYAPDPERPDESVIVGGMNNARSWWPAADFTWGTAAFHLLEKYGIHF